MYMYMYMYNVFEGGAHKILRSRLDYTLHAKLAQVGVVNNMAVVGKNF